MDIHNEALETHQLIEKEVEKQKKKRLCKREHVWIWTEDMI